MALLVVLAIIVGYMLACGWVCALIARKRGLNETGWWLSVGIFVSPISWIVAAFWPQPKPGDRERPLSAYLRSALAEMARDRALCAV
jgi:hypothetical protein